MSAKSMISSIVNILAPINNPRDPPMSPETQINQVVLRNNNITLDLLDS